MHAVTGESLETLFSEAQLAARVAELGATLRPQTEAEPTLVVGVLTGAAVFTADLMRHLDPRTCLDFIAVSSYEGGTSTTGAVKLTRDLSCSVENRHLILVEDIIDTGLTMRYLSETLALRKPASIRVVTLLDKPSRRRVDYGADHVGFTIPDHFVVGYGLDYAQRYRGLPCVAKLTLAE